MCCRAGHGCARRMRLSRAYSDEHGMRHPHVIAAHVAEQEQIAIAGSGESVNAVGGNLRERMLAPVATSVRYRVARTPLLLGEAVITVCGSTTTTWPGL